MYNNTILIMTINSLILEPVVLQAIRAQPRLARLPRGLILLLLVILIITVLVLALALVLVLIMII